ncbi:GNAT family N-acetyltransferase [Nocardioides sp. zg-1308]|uniref:GNAT family N-acetyltransferase n=1 Tax=Nocardioides sp. zg-1308 TaxID=2736253 RepID=UPI001551B78A|nr:GNAT family N-acetyltransferase [Nocardioides sp. zg-1308]
MPDPPALRRLETSRLVLRRRRPEEAATYRQLWTERDPRVPARRRIDTEGRPTIDDIREQVRAESSRSGLVVLAVVRRDTSEVIGYCGLFTVDGRPSDEPELAFELLRSVHGHGLATEAARAVVEWAEQAGLPRLWADVWDWNTASRRVLDKLGFRETGAATAGEHGVSLTTVLELQPAPRRAARRAARSPGRPEHPPS